MEHIQQKKYLVNQRRLYRAYPTGSKRTSDVCTTTTQRVPNVMDVWNTLGSRWTNVAGSLGREIGKPCIRLADDKGMPKTNKKIWKAEEQQLALMVLYYTRTWIYGKTDLRYKNHTLPLTFIYIFAVYAPKCYYTCDRTIFFYIWRYPLNNSDVIW